MSEFAGFSGHGLGSQEVNQRARGLAGALCPDGSRPDYNLSNPSGCLVGHGRRPWIDAYDGESCQIIIVGDCWWSGARSLDRPSEVAARLGAGYTASGIDAVQHLRGHFAVAIQDLTRDRVYLVADRIGTRPVYFHHKGDDFVFGTRASSITDYPGVDTELDQQAMYDYLFFHMVPAPLSMWRQIRRLEPGHWACLNRGRLEIKRYHRFDFRVSDAPMSHLKKACHMELDASIKPYTQLEQVGVFLSGGLDSSTVAGKFSQLNAGPTQTYTIGFESEGYDESEFARIAAEHFGTNPHQYYVTPDDVIAGAERLGGVFDVPFGNSSAVPTYYCAKLAAADGVRTMLAGDGGDEIFAGNARYATQWLFSLLELVPSPGRYALGKFAATSALESLMPVRKLKSYVRQASVPMPHRLHTYNLLRRVGAERIFSADVMAAVDESAPDRLSEQVWNDYEDAGLLNGMLAYDWRFTLSDNDLIKVTRATAAAGVDAVYPLLQDNLVEFANTLPPSMKLRRTRLRHFYKESMRGFLHDATINKSKHGFGLPFGVWVWQHERVKTFVCDQLRDLDSRGLIRAAFIDELIDTLLPNHPAFYGELGWLLVMLEQWFKNFGQHPARSAPSSQAANS